MLMDFYSYLLDENKWNEFLLSKTDSFYISKKHEKMYTDYINNKKYLPIVNKIINEDFEFSIPKKISMDKIGKKKKRIVYKFNKNESILLKYINFLTYEYDDLFSPNLYSFRKNKSVKDAIHKIQYIHNLKNMYAYKVDISNYFNSIPIDKLLNKLEKEIDYNLYKLFKNILSSNKVIYNKMIIEEEKGIMAGVAISAFLSNFYLKDMDNYFHNNNINYFRYADDIIVFGNSYDDIISYKNIIMNFLSDNGLLVNNDKEYYFNPGDCVDFLGFSINGNIIDISRSQVAKIKLKIKRSSHKIRKWKLEKNVKDIPTLYLMNKIYNNKFYGARNDELSWKYWFFTTINTTDSLHEIDLYMQECQRYIITGVHNKKNYEKVPYKLLKRCYYKPLVHEYYAFHNYNEAKEKTSH